MSTKNFVQDNEPQVIYSDGWSQVLSTTGEHGNTAHLTTQVGATATFRFRGIGVKFLITVPSVPEGTTGLVDILINLDGQSFSWQKEALTITLIGQIPFELQAGLDPEREHVLTITQRGQTGSSQSLPLRLDSLEYIALGGSDPISANTTPFSTDGTLSTLSEPPNPGVTSSPQQPSSTSVFPPSQTQTPSTQLDLPQSTSRIVTGGPSQSRTSDLSGTVSTSDTIPASGSTAIVTTASDGIVVTKIVPLDHYAGTQADSTGGLVIQTQPGGAVSKEDERAISTGNIIAVVFGTIIFLGVTALVVLLFLKRKKRRRAMAMERDMEGHQGEDIRPTGVSPFVTSTPLQAAPHDPDVAPPAYELGDSIVSVPPLKSQ